MRHQTKLEQCLQLRHFEHNYREVSCIPVLPAHSFPHVHATNTLTGASFLPQVRTLLDQVAEKLASFSEVGISPAHADHTFSELTAYEARVCVSNGLRHSAD